MNRSDVTVDALESFDYDIPSDAPVLEVTDICKAELGRRAVPKPGTGQVLVRVDYSGVSVGTETWAATRQIPPSLDEWGPPPYIPGYQAVGRIAALGDEVSASKFAVGDIVAVCASHAHQRYVVADDVLVFPIESSANLVATALFVVCAAGGNFLNRAGVQSGSSVMVVGQGLVGQITAKLAALRGAYVVSTEVFAERISLSSKYCVDRVIDATSVPPSEQVVDQFPEGVDVVLHTANIPINDSLKCVRPGGTFIWIGGNPVGGLTFDVEEPHRKEIRWMFANGVGGLDNLERAAHMLSSGMLDISPLITHCVGWSDCVDVYNSLFVEGRESFNGIVFDWRNAE